MKNSELIKEISKLHKRSHVMINKYGENAYYPIHNIFTDITEPLGMDDDPEEIIIIQCDDPVQEQINETLYN